MKALEHKVEMDPFIQHDGETAVLYRYHHRANLEAYQKDCNGSLQTERTTLAIELLLVAASLFHRVIQYLLVPNCPLQSRASASSAILVKSGPPNCLSG